MQDVSICPAEAASDTAMRAASMVEAVAAECLPQLFDAQVDRTPNRTAFLFAGERFTYGELDAAANRVARLLIARGVGPESIVALLLPRSPELLIALLGIVKAGAAYLPMDTDYPAARLTDMLEDSDVAQVLTTSEVWEQQRMPQGVPSILLDIPAIRSELKSYSPSPVSDAERVRPLRPENLLYVIFTSGSTGRPKGVAIEHRNFVHLMKAMVPRVRLEENQTFLALSTICFDLAGLEIFLPLLQGAVSVMLSGADSRDPVRVVEAVERLGINAMHAVPTFWRALIASKIPRTVRLFSCGEALPSAMVPDLLEFPEAVNLYGPTETTVLSSLHRVVAEDANRGPNVSLGRPIEGEELYILDERFSPVTGDAIGELYIAGAGLARGYVNRPELTAERFLDCPFGAPGGRMYKTGDLARWREDGSVEFLGRADQQVKIRGFRIEPGEIESTLVRVVPAIRECVVVVREIGGHAHLVAYHVDHPGIRPREAGEMRALLAESLPSYMVPRFFKRLDCLPLAHNGKLDRLALPQPNENADRPYFRAPKDSLEVSICKIFRQFAGGPRVGRDDDFFQLGGNSLAAMLCVHRLRRELNCELTLRQFLGGPTPRALARILSGDDVGLTSTPAPSKKYPVIFLLPGVGGDTPPLVRFRMEWEGVARVVPLEHPKWKELIDAEQGMETLVRDCLRRIAQQAPDGPIWLMGYSLGGNVAHALALRLVEQGRQVGFVGLLDAEAIHEDAEVVAAQLLGRTSLLHLGWHFVRDIGRLLREIRERQSNRALALTLVRWVTTPWGWPIFSWLAKHGRLPLPVMFRYHVNDYLNQARLVAAAGAWCDRISKHPRPLPVPAVLFRSEAHRPEDAADLGWTTHFPELEIVHLSGTHSTMFEPPHLEILCDRAQRVLDQLTVSHSSRLLA